MAIKRIEINYWEGVNRNVAPFLAKKNELYRAENVRSGRAGLLEKRGGTRRLGDDISAITNLKLHHFTDENSASNKFYRISKVGGVVTIYYLNTSSNWTALTGYGTTLCVLGASDSQFDISNPTGTTFRYTWDGTGTDPTITTKVYIGDELIINAQNFSAVNNGTFTVINVSTNYFDVTNASGVAESNKTIGTGSITFNANFDMCNARGSCYVVNLRDSNRVIQSAGSVSLTDGFTGSPIAERVRYYKNRLYLANYRIGAQRYKNGVAFSSVPLGIKSLVDGDHDSFTSIGASSTSFNITNPSGTTFRYTYNKTGTNPYLLNNLIVGDRLDIDTENFSAANDGLYTITGVGTSLTGVGDSTTQIDITLGTGDTMLYAWDATGTAPLFSTYFSVGDEIVLNAQNFSAVNNGTFRVTSVDATSFTIVNASGTSELNKTIGTGSISYKREYFEVTNASGVVESNKTIGTGYIIKLGNINVTSSKYIGTSDTLNVYRAGSLITTLSIDSKTETSIRVSDATSYVALKNGDELWASGTFAGTRTFFWATNPITGIDIKRYDTFEIPCEGSNDDEIIMMEVVGNILTFGTKNNLAYYNEASLTSLNNGIGCVSKKGYIKNKGVLYFIHYSGIYSLSGASSPVIISTNVEPYITGATKTNLDKAVASKQGYSVFFYIGDVTLYNIDGSIEKEVEDVTLEYDTRKERWYVHIGVEMNCAGTYISSSDTDRLIYGDPTDGEAFQFLFGTADKDVTSTISIPMMATTHPIYLGTSFDKFAYPLNFIIEILRGTNIKVFASLDDGHFFEIGEANKGINRMIIRGVDESSGQSNYPVKCRKINISFRESSIKGVIIGRTALEYAETEEDIQKIET